MFAATWAYRIELPSLYVSLDTDLRSQALRVVAMLRNLPVDEVKANPDRFSAWLAKQQHPVRWSASPISVDELDQLVLAETEFLGEVPSLVVIDSVADLVREESYEEYVHVFAGLRKTAKKFKCVILALHHLKTGTEFDGTKRVSLNDTLFSGQRQPEIVLGICRPTPDDMRVGVLKNRMGAADRLCGYYAELGCDMSRAQLSSYDQLEEYRRAMLGGKK